MAESISKIKEKFQAARVNGLPDLISEYLEDERKGVKDIIEKAKTRILEDEKEALRIWEMQSFERQYGDRQYICGIDEAGRGPFAGPVVAAAVILPKDCDIRYINDSKQLTAKKRDELFDIINEKAVSVGVGMASHERIDEINILNATYEAMKDAVKALKIKPDILLNDAVRIPGLEIEQIPITKGDAKSLSIAAASIIAKVTRDRLMEEYDLKYPGYGFAIHSGYGVPKHIEALKSLGPCDIHRRSFIKKYI